MEKLRPYLASSRGRRTLHRISRISNVAAWRTRRSVQAQDKARSKSNALSSVPLNFPDPPKIYSEFAVLYLYVLFCTYSNEALIIASAALMLHVFFATSIFILNNDGCPDTLSTNFSDSLIQVVLSGHARNKNTIITIVSNLSNCLLLAGELLIFASQKEVTIGHCVSVTSPFDVDKTLASMGVLVILLEFAQRLTADSLDFSYKHLC